MAWIETFCSKSTEAGRIVATREGGVDRNALGFDGRGSSIYVATREGGVDRNIKYVNMSFIGTIVATREGGVDRNMFWLMVYHR